VTLYSVVELFRATGKNAKRVNRFWASARGIPSAALTLVVTTKSAKPNARQRTSAAKSAKTVATYWFARRKDVRSASGLVKSARVRKSAALPNVRKELVNKLGRHGNTVATFC
jgi:hypothetical protein